MDIFSGVIDFFEKQPDLIVPLLSVLGTTIIVLYTVCVVLSRISNYDKIRYLRGYNQKTLDFELVVYLIVFVLCAMISFRFNDISDELFFVAVIIFSTICSYFIITKNVIDNIVKTIKIKQTKQKDKVSESATRIFKLSTYFMVFGSLIGFFFIRDVWILFFVAISFILFLSNMNTTFLNNDDNSKVEIGIIENNAITLVSGVICFETSSEIFFEIFDKNENKSYIYRYNKSYIQYIKSLCD